MSEPLGLPRGSVRAILTLALVAVSAALLFVPAKDADAKSMFLLLTGIAVRDYFATRSTQNEQDGPPLDPPSIG
jgi:hypothetical protein